MRHRRSSLIRWIAFGIWRVYGPASDAGLVPAIQSIEFQVRRRTTSTFVFATEPVAALHRGQSSLTGQKR